MTVSEWLDKVNFEYRGTDDDAPTFGDEEAVAWLSVLNTKKDEFYRDTKQRWGASFKQVAPNEPGTVATTGTTALTGTSTKFTDYQAGDTITVDGETSRIISTITSDTALTVTVAFSNTASSKTFTHKSIVATGDATYSLHRSFLVPSDIAYVTDTDGNVHEYDIVKPQERDRYTQQIFISGVEPQVANFAATIASTDQIVGGTLTVPGYYVPADLTATTDVLPFRNPYWAVYSVAAELAYNDVVYETKAADLTEKANSLYKEMVVGNRTGTHANGRRVPVNVKRIESPTRR